MACSSRTICFRIYMIHVVLEVSIDPDLHDSCSSGSLHRSGTRYCRIYMAARSGSTLVPDLAATDLRVTLVSSSGSFCSRLSVSPFSFLPFWLNVQVGLPAKTNPLGFYCDSLYYYLVGNTAIILLLWYAGMTHVCYKYGSWGLGIAYCVVISDRVGN